MEKNLISVVMPVWNTKPNFLSQSIRSMLEQTYTNLELLVIYEKTLQEIDSHIEKIFEDNSDDHRLKIINSSEKGFTNSLNVGLLKSGGQFIARMDSDDISEKTRFEEQIEYLNNTKIDLIGSWAHSISEEGVILGKIETPITHLEIRRKIMFHNPFLHPSILFKKEILGKIGNYNPKFEGAEDYDFYLRVVSSKFQVSNIPKYLIQLRETQGSIMRGEVWRKKRAAYLKVKNNAVKNLGFNKLSDRLYYYLTPLTLLVSPKLANVLKNKFGYNK